MKELIITIDGPAGSGKTTVAKNIAKKLNLNLLESGAIYRAITFILISQENFEHLLESEQDLENFLDEVFSKIRIELTPAETKIWYDGKALKEELRSKKVEDYVSMVSANRLVRNRITQFLRNISKGQRIITEGRDMGSVVFPSAKIKIYLTADLLERAKRRLKDMNEDNLEEVLKKLADRDDRDSKRDIAPLVIPEGAIVIDTTNLTLDEVIEKVEAIIKERDR